MITPEEAKAELAKRELCRRHLKHYVPYVDPFFGTKKWYLMKDFHEVISDKIQQLYQGTLMKDWKVCKRLIYEQIFKWLINIIKNNKKN